MAEKSVADRVKEIIIDQLGVNPDQVMPEAKFIEDLGCDELDGIELIMVLEEEFAIEIPDADDVEKKIETGTVGDLVKYIEGRLA